MSATDEDVNKRDFEYQDDYEAANFTIEHMTPFDEAEYLSDNQSDSESSSSANSMYYIIIPTIEQNNHILMVAQE